jgi:putative peptide zinc metalloprotease protein
VVVVLSRGWLYFVHGSGDSVHATLYRPDLMLVVLGLVILSAGFHELGHASALRYGGGRARRIGMGLYLIYPAFYTDVSDNYRLGRWARVRTDLGGFYFNLIFTLGLIVLYVITGQEFLLFVVVLIDLAMVYQSLPVVRFDGYWALTDLTGIPDLFSQIGPFVRSVVPWRGWKGRRLPKLKGWVKVVFGVYTLVTVPLLVFLLLLLLKSLPDLLTTAWDSFVRQSDGFSTVWMARDVVGLMVAGVHMVMLALPTFGILLILFKLSRRISWAIWTWSKPTWPRRLIGSLGAAGVLTFLAFLWAPQLLFWLVE